jgi:hypothetical protein
MKNEILERLKEEKEMRLKGCLYHYTQVKFAYNTNRIEGSRLTEDETRYIYETNTISTGDGKTANVNDIIETVNHFSCFNYLLSVAERPLSEEIIKEFHNILKRGSSDSFKEWFKVGDYKMKDNFVGEMKTTSPQYVGKEMKKLILDYVKEGADMDKIVKFHYDFEAIHPFQDGNGRVGRLIMFKECLKNGITPFIIENENKQFYYLGLKEYPDSKTRLIETCLFSQDMYAEAVKYFGIAVNEKNSVKKGSGVDNLAIDVKFHLGGKKVMDCYKYDVKKSGMIDFRGKEIFIDSTEIISGKSNVCKLNCKDKDGGNLYLLQKAGKVKTEIWYFKDNFNNESALEFIRQFGLNYINDKKNIKKSNRL